MHHFYSTELDRQICTQREIYHWVLALVHRGREFSPDTKSHITVVRNHDLSRGACELSRSGTSTKIRTVQRLLRSSPTMSLPFDTLEPRGPARIVDCGCSAMVSIYPADEQFVLKGSEV
jgi:hypothetical protein